MTNSCLLAQKCMSQLRQRVQMPALLLQPKPRSRPKSLTVKRARNPAKKMTRSKAKSSTTSKDMGEPIQKNRGELVNLWGIEGGVSLSYLAKYEKDKYLFHRFPMTSRNASVMFLRPGETETCVFSVDPGDRQEPVTIFEVDITGSFGEVMVTRLPLGEGFDLSSMEAFKAAQIELGAAFPSPDDMETF